MESGSWGFWGQACAIFVVWGVGSWVTTSHILIDLDYLVQAFADLGKKRIRHFFLRMNRCPAYPPVERFGLVTEDITGFSGTTLSPDIPGCNGKGIVRIIFSRGHGQTDDQGGFVVEITR